MTDLLLTGIGHLTTNVGDPIAEAAVKIESGTIVYAGPESDAPDQGPAERVDCLGQAVIPGFVDSHTHLVFGGDRADEFAMKMAGASYAEVAKAGGGILSTVAATPCLVRGRPIHVGRNQGEPDDRRQGQPAWRSNPATGWISTPKSTLLRVARKISTDLPVSVKTTFLGAHVVPVEFGNDRAAYVDLLVEEMLPAAAPLSDFCDVFVEEGAFSVAEAQRIFAAAQGLGLRARVHAEQLSHSGGAALAAEIGAASADHLDHVTDEDARALAAAGVVAVLAPGASYTMRSPQAPGPMLLDHRVTVALATDCNPGTSYFESLGPVISLAVVQMGLSVEQAIHAATRGGALALGMGDHGLIAPGSAGDVVLLDAPSPAHLPYRPGANLVRMTIKAGRVVFGH